MHKQEVCAFSGLSSTCRPANPPGVLAACACMRQRSWGAYYPCHFQPGPAFWEPAQTKDSEWLSLIKFIWCSSFQFCLRSQVSVSLRTSQSVYSYNVPGHGLVPHLCVTPASQTSLLHPEIFTRPNYPNIGSLCRSTKIIPPTTLFWGSYMV